ncbi:MAG: sn-glycerol-3-phosphate import ATP-binding protein UgpC [Dehalococcoidia bacterium]|jgi:sn-glycerol 3-phosphate transport system ATP-binding protein|nr:sn-glycerol-3-phosphate import ATP-binding protein UgpC [Dehalococcoidia bacterium]
MAEISLHGVTKSFGKTEVIHKTDVTIDDGEFVVMVGPSGCGKSTLLRMIAGLETTTDGEIRIAGKRVNEVEPKDRNIAMVFQNYALYPHMSVYDNMAYGLKIRKFPKDDIERRVQRAAKILELGPYLQRKPRELSGGQRQRVAMGRAIVREPAAFLFDEPLSNLDAKLRVQMRLEIQKLHRELATTSVYVTHDQVEAMTLANRMIVINAGVVEQIGAPLEVYDNPASLFVAGFIGSPSMNFMPGRRAGDGVDVGDGLVIPLPPEARAKAGEQVTVGVRPEHFVAGAGGGGPVFRLHVDTVESLGADSLLHAGFNGTLLVVRIEGHSTPKAGTALDVSILPGKAYFFDTATGKRLAA